MKVDRRRFKAATLLLIIAFAGGASAICSDDGDCSTGYYCDEGNLTGGLPQCSLVDWTTGCGGVSVTCSSDSDCYGIGQEECHASGVCLFKSQLGEPCFLDDDCVSGYCVGTTCTPTRAEYCIQDSNCDYGCYINMCIYPKILGSGCNSNADCQSGTCDSALDFCVECDSTWGQDGDGNIPSGTYCDIFNYVNCSLDYPYPLTSYAQNKPVPVITDLKEEGDSCDNDGCCLTNNCVDGQCVGIGEIDVSNETSTFCETYGRDLESSWFDGASSVSDPPNTTFFEEIYGKSDLTLVRNWYPYNGYNHTDDGWSYWYRDAGARLDSYSMVVVFYDTTEEDICYFKQLGSKVVWACANLSDSYRNASKSNSTHSIFTDSFQAFNYDNTFAIISSGDQVISTNDHFGIMGIVFGHSGQDVYHDVLSTGDDQNKANNYGTRYRFLTTGDGSYSQIQSETCNGLGGGYHTNHGFGIDRNDLRSNYAADAGYCMAYALGLNQVGTVDTIISSYTQYGYDWRLPASSNPPSTGWVNQKITKTLDYEFIYCCSHDSTCISRFGDAACCDLDTYTCLTDCTGDNYIRIETYFSGQEGRDVFCPSETATLTAKLKKADGTQIYPDGEIEFEVESGSVVPASCDASGTCSVQYTARATEGSDRIIIRYTGSRTYMETTQIQSISVSDACMFMKIYVADCEIDEEAYLKNVKITVNGVQYNTGTRGYVFIDGLENADQSVAFEKEGYEDYTHNITSVFLNKELTVCLYKTDTEYLDDGGLNYAFDPTPPNGSADAVRGMKEIALKSFPNLVNWIFVLVLFLFAIGIIAKILKSVI